MEGEILTIERKTSNETKPYKNRNYLFYNYELLGLSTRQIAKKCGAVNSTVLTWLNKFNIRVRTRSDFIGEKAPSYGIHWSWSEESKDKITGNKHPNWKGNNVKNLSICQIHRRIEKVKSKPEDGKCAICRQVADKKGITELELSNFKYHDYTLNPDDYQYAHHSCHNTYDAKRRKN